MKEKKNLLEETINIYIDFQKINFILNIKKL